MCSLPYIQSPSNIDVMSSLEQTTDAYSGEVKSRCGKKARLSLDMSKCEDIDDTFIVPPCFDEDTSDADEFKQSILNTNLIINRTSFGSKCKRPDPEEMLPPK